jgi:glucokinase
MNARDGNAMDRKVALAIDIGGTKVAVGLVTDKGVILHRVSHPMIVTGSASDALACVHRAIDEVMHDGLEARPSVIGVSAPGPLDPHRGVVLQSPNMPCWRDYHLLEEIQKAYGLPTRIDNDANAAGLAEATWGAGAGYENVFYSTIGTGIGTAIVLNGIIFHGRTGAAAEGGHMSVDFHGPIRCGCKKPGCIEGLASGPAIAQRVREMIVREKDRGTNLLAGGGPGSITAETIVKAWKDGDKLAEEALVQTADYLSVWLGNIIDLLEPDVMIIGGGFGSRITGWFDYICSRIPAWSINPRANEIPLVVAKYGADAGIAGSAALWFCESAKEHVAAERQ